MAGSLYDFLRKEIQRMMLGIGVHNEGNIYPLIVEEVERSIIKIVLEETSGNLFASAKMLGISRSTLYRKIKDLHIEQNYE
jgi:DNA-binding protein Fis